MKTLTFNLDVQLDHDENWIAKNTVVQVADDAWKQYEGFTPVIITDAYDYNGNKIKVNKIVDYFSNCSFVEYQKEAM